MTGASDFRSAHEVRGSRSDDGGHYVVLRAIKPGVVDDYGTVWKADAFDQSLSERLPVLVWAHDWQEPLGRAVSFRRSSEGPEVRFRFSDFAAVPMGLRAWTQVMDGTIDDCSVGFSAPKKRNPTESERAMYRGVREVIEKATLDEVSLVLRGAVPGAKVLEVRGQSAPPVESPRLVEARRLWRLYREGAITAEQLRTGSELDALLDGCLDHFRDIEERWRCRDARTDAEYLRRHHERSLRARFGS